MDRRYNNFINFYCLKERRSVSVPMQNTQLIRMRNNRYRRASICPSCGRKISVIVGKGQM